MQPAHQVFERHEMETGQKTACLIAAGSSQITGAGEEIPDSGFCLNYPSGKNVHMKAHGLGG